MGQATIFADIAPLYEGASRDTHRVDEVLYGMSVQVISDEDGWCYLRTDYGTEGYTPTSGIGTNIEVANAWRKYPKSVVLAHYIDVQKAPSADSPRLAAVPRGGLLVALGQPGYDGWQKVGLPNGTIGYTRASYLGEVIADWTLLSEDDMRWNIVESALAYNGAAYRSGGRTILGMDSVGLAGMAYFLNGITVPREPFVKQGGVLHTIPLEELGEGDLLYFRNSVGVYMGNDKFIHATEIPGNEGVLVSSLNPQDMDYSADLAEHIVAVASIF